MTSAGLLSASADDESGAGNRCDARPPDSVTLLFLLRDLLPAFRPDVAVLFGKALLRLGVSSDLIGQQDPETTGQTVAWPAGRAHITGVGAKGIRGELIRTWQDMHALWKFGGVEHDAIQVRDKIRTGLGALVLARLWRRPFIYWMSFPIAEGHVERARQVGHSQGWIVWLANAVRAGLARACLYRLVLRYADHVFVQSEAMLEFVHARGVPRQRMTPVPMGVDVDRFTAVRTPSVQPAAMVGRRVIVYLGALAHARRSDFLLEVVQRVRERCPEVLLVLAGDAPSADEQAWIRRRVRELEVESHVWLTGWLSQEEALPLVRCAELGLSPIPRGELFDVSSPTKAVEYLALGLPCVGNDIPDQRLVLERSEGGLCVPMEVEPFADAILELLDDPDRRARMGRSGAAWVAKYRSYDQLAERVAPVYRQLVAGGSTADAGPL